MPPDFAVAYRPAPLLALAGRRVTSVACGGSHTLALVTPPGGGAPVVHAWGTGTVGQLGLGEATPVSEAPRPVALPAGHAAVAAGVPVVAVFAGLVSSAALAGSGDAFLWGDASLGRLGLPGIQVGKGRGGGGRRVPMGLEHKQRGTQFYATTTSSPPSSGLHEGRGGACLRQ